MGDRRREARSAASKARGPLGTPSQPALRTPVTLTSLGAAVPPLESSPWRGGCLWLALGPVVFGFRSGPGGVARAPRPRHDSRRHSEPGASSPGGNNGAEAGVPEAGRGGGLGSAAGGPQIVRPPLSRTRRWLLTLLAAQVPSPLWGLRCAQTAALVWCAPGSEEKSSGSAAFPDAARALAAGKGEVAAMR